MSCGKADIGTSENRKRPAVPTFCFINNLVDRTHKVVWNYRQYLPTYFDYIQIWITIPPQQKITKFIIKSNNNFGLSSILNFVSNGTNKEIIHQWLFANSFNKFYPVVLYFYYWNHIQATVLILYGFRNF
jgi:hypothetical protein